MDSGGCAVSKIPADRWPHSLHYHPRTKERGRSYTFAAGVLDDIWGFDPSVFRISPREAEQIDPQQRLLLELAFEACENAGFAPSSLAGTKTGVYVGASALDYSIIGLHDPALTDAYYATGNALSIISNRLSYIFDLHGPSLTIDTACSSSLVALHEACQALAHGDIDAALVGGVNILASPYGFVSFSQATMLSPTGLCQAFSAEADGYVRSEGGVVLALKRLDRAVKDGDRIHAVICGAGVNSDGRTNGVSLPSLAHQSELLRTVYDRAGVAPDSVVYVEAHGTGTQAGDPVEASALGAVLGKARENPLPIGSIKTNIGHTEPASGLAGLMKAMLVLEHDRAPKSLHFKNPNPNIDFAGLNLKVTAEPTPLARTGAPRFAGVSSFGFGGTNAHVVISDPPIVLAEGKAEPRYLMLSAQSEGALRALAGAYADRLAETGQEEGRRVVAATAYRRERMPQRLALVADDRADLTEALSRFARSGEIDRKAARGVAVDGDGSIVFVFSGNGSQWPGMGQAAFRASKDFRDAFAAVDAVFKPLAGWSLTDEMFSPNLRHDLPRASIAQPLVFAIQAASVRALAKLGVRPSLVMGHSVGEVAAAEAAGILSLEDAVKVIYHRSRHQELTENAGGMSVILGPREAAEALVAEFPSLAVAAHNSHQCVVAAGPYSALEALAKAASKRKLRARQLDLAYPFHTSFMEPVRRHLIRDLAELSPSAGKTPFLSTIAPGIMPGQSANALYWWRNVREKVLFHEGVEYAIELGKRVFLEIGPNGPLKGHIRDTLEHHDVAAFVDMALDDRSKELDGDPFERSVTRLLASGAEVDRETSFGPDPGAGTDLPAYPWRRAVYRYGETTEATGKYSVRPRHPLVGARDNLESLEWRAVLDPDVEPALADHRVDGQTILPGAAFIEMAIAVARDWKGDDGVALNGFEILQPLVFAANSSREILCRISASTATIEIMSRPRLSKAAFALHARGGIVLKPGPAAESGAPAPIAAAADSAALIYERALRSGLEFGPAYRRLARAARTGFDAIGVELTPEPGDARYGLDPARLDSCFHGLILLFDQADARANAYLPVRFDEVRLLKPGAQLARAQIRVKRRDARVIIADFELFDDQGELSAVLRGARYQAMRGRADLSLAQTGLVRTWIPAAAPISVAEPGCNLRVAAKESRAEPELPPDAVLIEGWASAAAFDLARALSVNGVVDIEELVVTGRLSPERRRWAESLFAALLTSGLVAREGGAYRIGDQAMPSPEAVFFSLAAQHPHRATEILLAARMGATLRDFGRGVGALTAPPEAAREAFELRSPCALAAAKTLGARLDRIAESSPNAPALRILQIGNGPTTVETLRFAAASGAAVTILDTDARRLERARISHGHAPETTFCGDLDALPESGFDLVVSAGGLSRLCANRGALPRLLEKCASNAALIAVEPAPSLFQDLVFGLDEDWFGDDGARLRTSEEWRSLFSRAGFSETDAAEIGTESDPAIIVQAQAPAKPAKAAAESEVVILREAREDDAFARSLKDALTAGGAVCRFASLKEIAALKTDKAAKLIWLAGEAKGDGVARVAAHCLALKDLAFRPSGGKLQVFATVRGADRPAAEAVLSFVRALANEAPTIDFRRIDIAGETPKIARRLAAFVLSKADETDVAIDDETIKALRYEAPDVERASEDFEGERTYRLEKGVDGGLDRLTWRPTPRRAPEAGEVEVEVTATGLNFRDVMWSLSILPDEMLEDGFAGPTLGLEFSGRVTRVGPGVSNLRVNDEVVGFCGGAFSAHVTVDADHVAALPRTISCEAAATIPVAFLTAYYGLVSCADLQAGEWVLIHGGAGGVGLAALQIAQWRGARAIVTAGSPEKRDLARALGAEHAFDSRSGAFVDDVMAATEGRGVAVVLNSLAGEAMERSLGLLQPFGRFVELGKRDYLANTPIGLRPFRRNLSYFGVDLDQLLKSRPDMSRRLFAEVLALFSSGDLSPLPYGVFAHSEIVEAMRLMQQSGHIGKILVRPPKGSAAARFKRRAFSVNPQGAHLITGGLGGFGLAAANWLVERGARHLVLVGRSGASTEEAREAVELMRSRGAEVLVEALDIADRKSAHALFEKIAASMPPLAGVIHAAMVLDDAIIANTDEARLVKVLWPKIAGAEILDHLTRDLALDYFVLFSSATTIIGNPGQGAYVAANGFLEGLARRRREAGLPALAIAWGAISDVGVLARKSATLDSLASRAGVKGIDARTALNLMAEALSLESGGGGDGLMVIADMNWSTAKAHLPLLNSPSYKRLLNGDGAAAPSRNVVDLRELAARLPPDEARREVANIIIEELARILRLPREDVSKTKPLSEIGLDSLMAVELTLGLEERFGLDAPLSGLAGGFNVMELAGQVLASQGQDEQSFTLAESLAAVHLDEAERAEVGEFIDALQESGVDLRPGYSRQSASAG